MHMRTFTTNSFMGPHPCRTSASSPVVPSFPLIESFAVEPFFPDAGKSSVDVVAVAVVDRGALGSEIAVAVVPVCLVKTAQKKEHKSSWIFQKGQRQGKLSRSDLFYWQGANARAPSSTDIAIPAS